MISSEHTQLQIGGEQVEIIKILGEGGTKTVLETSIWGLRRALAIPNQVDTNDVRVEKWKNVEAEAKNAHQLQQAGLLTIPEYEPLMVEIDGGNLPCIAMTPFSELPFEVYDSKNGNRTYLRGPLSNINHFSEIYPEIAPIGGDIQKLVEAGILLKSDSISFARMPEGHMRLFLYDLQGMDHTDDTDGLGLAYADLVVSKLDNVFDREQLMRFSSQGYDFEKRRELARKLIIE